LAAYSIACHNLPVITAEIHTYTKKYPDAGMDSIHDGDWLQKVHQTGRFQNLKERFQHTRPMNSTRDAVPVSLWRTWTVSFSILLTLSFPPRNSRKTRAWLCSTSVMDSTLSQCSSWAASGCPTRFTFHTPSRLTEKATRGYAFQRG
jgi:hypothetical protein